jgi:hypothetical protein
MQAIVRPMVGFSRSEGANGIVILRKFFEPPIFLLFGSCPGNRRGSLPALAQTFNCSDFNLSTGP